jgi:uncharacterized protein YkwD
LAAVNARRASGATCGSTAYAAAGALEWHAQLAQAATGHSEDMVANNFFSHTGSDGSTLGQRATRAGYAWRTVGENLAAGQVGIDNAVSAWMSSPGHCANLMNGSFRELGVACVNGSSGNRYATYWTMVLGAR